MAEETEPAAEAKNSLLFVLLSFQGRINRKMFWIKGVLALFILEIIIFGGLALAAFLMLGDVYLQGMGLASAVNSPPAVTKQFSQKGDGLVVGAIKADTGAAKFEVRMTADNATTQILKRVVIGGRQMFVTAARKPGDGPPLLRRRIQLGELSRRRLGCRGCRSGEAGRKNGAGV